MKLGPRHIRSSPWLIMQPVRHQIRIAMGLASLASAAAMASLWQLACVIQQLLAGTGHWPWISLLLATLWTVLAFVFRLASFNRSHYAAFALEAHLRTDLSEHLGRISLGQVQQQGAAALAKVMMDDVKAMHVFVADSTPLYARAYISPLLTLILLCWLDWRLALAASGVLILGLAAVSLALFGSTETFKRYHAAAERVSEAVVEYVQAMPVVRSFDLGSETFRRYQRALQAYRDIVIDWYRCNGLPSRLSQIILSPLPTLLVLLATGIWLQQRQQLNAGHWLAVLVIGTGMAEAMMPMISLKHLVARAMVSIRRIQQVMDIPHLPIPKSEVAQSPGDASIRFEAVDFRYGVDTALVLRQVSFEVRPGQLIALVGPSGAGKSTVAQLIPRFWDVTAGRIRIGGVDIRQMLPETLMQQVAFVFQDTFLFSASLLDNIRLGQPQASRDQVIAAAQAAQAHEFIMKLPKGYDTQAGERGCFLSGGQRQRITIARAILQNRPILVLDEATAFADPENEAALISALSQLMQGKTVLMIAHRLSTIRDADRILVLEAGQLVEQGRHAQLLAQQGRYANLWQASEQAGHWTLEPCPT